MKVLLIILPCFLLVQTCLFRPADNTTGKTTDSLRQKKEQIDFEKLVKPILVKNCSPCHFTGGKMYERLPFDKDTTIINHNEKILRRIKNEEENTILKTFILQNKKSLP
jgi:subtilase family serine protease